MWVIQTGSNLTMSTKVFNYNINTKNMSNKEKVGNAHKKKNYLFIALCIFYSLTIKIYLLKCFSGTIGQAVASCCVSAS